MTDLFYAGIGARSTPDSVLADMTKMATWLAGRDWQLASGGAKGADQAFSAGAPAELRTLYLPWAGYNGHRGPDCFTLRDDELAPCLDLAARAHPAWHRCSASVRKLHARNAAILLGPGLDHPAKSVVAWTPGGKDIGGTGVAIRIARRHGIPVFNLASLSPREVCERLRDIRRGA